MKILIALITSVSVFLGFGSENKIKTRPDGLVFNAKKSFYGFKMKTIDGKTLDFSTLKGKKVLIVNVASKCGLTPQYEELEKLHEQYGGKVVILGFPANNFMGQEPGTNEEISKFCKLKYDVKFQMMSKISVKGEDQDPLYQWLTKKELNGWNTDEPNWNFSKYLINEKGELVKFFKSEVKPLDKSIVDAISM